jgi:Protein of unknown function (DUF3106)
MITVSALGGWPIVSTRAGPPKGYTDRNPRSAKRSPEASPTRPESRAIAELDRMSPLEREKFLRQLPPQQRKQAEEDLRAYDGLSPDQKERVWRQYEAFRALSPSKQAEIREAYDSYQRVAPARQLAIQHEIRILSRLSPPDRKQRLASATFEGKFSSGERKIIHGLLEVPADP